METNLSGDCNFIMCFETQRTLAFVGVVKRNGHCGFGDTSLSIFVNQILKIRGSHLVKLNKNRKTSVPLKINFRLKLLLLDDI